MTADATPYRFRTACADDMPLLRHWLEQPHVRQWWGDPDREEALLRGDMDDDRVNMCVVSLATKQFAYIQDYDISDWPDKHFKGLPHGTRAIDMMVGEPDMIGKGHGGAILRQHAQLLRSKGAPKIVIDPDANKTVARKAYTNAGFHKVDIFTLDEGDFVLMEFIGDQR